jgi:tripartite-type tricarboxylate transporter receptor subunit TctC
MAFITAGFGAQKLVVLPKGTPKDIVAAYSQAFSKMQSDPQLVATKDKILGEYPQATGKDAQTLYRVATQVSPASRYWVREHLTQNYSVKFE